MAWFAILLGSSLLVLSPCVSKRIRIQDALKESVEQINDVRAGNLNQAAATVVTATDKEVAVEEVAVVKTVPCCGDRKGAKNGDAKKDPVMKSSTETAAEMKPHGDPLWSEAHHSVAAAHDERVTEMTESKAATHGDPLWQETQDFQGRIAQKARDKAAFEKAALEKAEAPEPAGFATRVGVRLRSLFGGGITGTPSAEPSYITSAMGKDATDVDTSAELEADDANAEISDDSSEDPPNKAERASWTDIEEAADIVGPRRHRPSWAEIKVDADDQATSPEHSAQAAAESSSAQPAADSSGEPSGESAVGAERREVAAAAEAATEKTVTTADRRPRRKSWGQIKMDEQVAEAAPRPAPKKQTESRVARMAARLEHATKDNGGAESENLWLRQRLLDQSEAAGLVNGVEQLVADREQLVAAVRGGEVSENAKAVTMDDPSWTTMTEEAESAAEAISEKEKEEANAKAIAETEMELSSAALALAAEKAETAAKAEQPELTSRGPQPTRATARLEMAMAAEKAALASRQQEHAEIVDLRHRHSEALHDIELQGGLAEAAADEERMRPMADAAPEADSSEQTRSKVSTSSVRDRVEKLEQRGKTAQSSASQALEDDLWRKRLEESGSGFVVSMHPEELAQGVAWDGLQPLEPREVAEAAAAVAAGEDSEPDDWSLASEQADAHIAQVTRVHAAPVSSDPCHIEVRLIGTHLKDDKREYTFELINGESGYVFTSRFSQLRNNLKPIFRDFPSDYTFQDFTNDAQNAAQRGEELRSFLQEKLNKPDTGEILTLPQVRAAFQCGDIYAPFLQTVVDARKAKAANGVPAEA